MSTSRRLTAATLVAAAMAATVGAWAGPRLNSLDIRVELQTDGDARVTEVRRMTIDSEGTECYIAIGNLDDGQGIDALEVSDDGGRRYDNIGRWDIHASRSQKTGRCGVVATGDGYELCWGLGASGERTYTTSYTIRNLTIGYPDADGFNWMFVARGLSPLPEAVRVRIVPGWGDGRFASSDSVRFWAFGCEGDITMVDGAVVAEAAGAFAQRSAMIVLMSLPKGIIRPSLTTSATTFDAVRERAFEGSDYDDDPVEQFFMWMCIAIFALAIVLPLGIAVWRFVQRYRLRHAAERDLTWWRDLPWRGNLRTANGVLNGLRYVGSDYESLLSAYVLRLVSLGALRIATATDAKGRTSQQLAIGAMPETSDTDEGDSMLGQLHAIFHEAAGDDGILQPKELERHMRQNAEHLQGFVAKLRYTASLDYCRREMEGVRQLYGLRKFLKDFTLSAERHATEVGLWKEYLVYATLFGIADQVRRDMKQINPEYFQLDKVASAMAGDAVVIPQLTHSTMVGTRSVQQYAAEQAARASGSGGHTSFGGGGGFHGGGIGGGVR